jgi:hypothetical protein
MIKTKDHARVLVISHSREKGIPNSRHKINCLYMHFGEGGGCSCKDIYEDLAKIVFFSPSSQKGSVTIVLAPCNIIDSRCGGHNSDFFQA